jgi:hypothetical protein
MVPSSTVHAAAARSKGKINYCEMMLGVVLATSWAACVSMLLPRCRCCDVVGACTRMVIDPRPAHHGTPPCRFLFLLHITSSSPPPPGVAFNGMLCVELLISLEFLLKSFGPCVGKATATVATTSSSLSVVSLSLSLSPRRKMGGAKHEREIHCSTKVRSKTVVNYSMHEALAK